MDIESIRKVCIKLPAVTEDIKWENDLCFLVAGKIFCIVCLNPPHTVSVKVDENEFDEMINKPGIIPAPYLARYKWVQLENLNVLSQKDFLFHLNKSYELVKSKLSKKLLKEFNL